MKKPFNKNKLSILWAANDALKGTNEYYRYRMYYESKCNGKWVYINSGVPYVDPSFVKECYVKTIKTMYGEDEWLYVVLRDGDIDRYSLKKEVKALLGI